MVDQDIKCAWYGLPMCLDIWAKLGPKIERTDAWSSQEREL